MRRLVGADIPPKQAEARPEFPNPVPHRLLMVHVLNTHGHFECPVDAARFAWRLDPERAARAEYVVSHIGGVVVGVFEAIRWMRATPENFPEYPDARFETDRYGFEGCDASSAVLRRYVGTTVPIEYRRPNATNPVRYTYK